MPDLMKRQCTTHTERNWKELFILGSELKTGRWKKYVSKQMWMS